jgi:hypothetical protein|uniref:Mitochondrial import inner membrane translocase subunit TIM50 n=1 Tax=Haptolina ericina TaxID=156174 RepID=A0A7S3B938_9EUKA|eukprot:CAMPEP_0181242138 /NCGR_PEP_ID=MMETSP1096-20121128/41514_1 /TAXON_ID=156174 ORGANISM="Chrysochromulina ericina, Strain CCMP281" /NCGR_SAMPLE_ID=MMETSP1096 /ASSEMBLY_ACC=CAM_ASM_000453 /LENGTH=176 /DNA_ID=CAMNT_0023338295 /DNA_START=25 /DNA_END=555 /DNA_ORIENTATION=-
MAPILFLDIDGVLCCHTSELLDEEPIAQLRRVVDQTGAEIVLSSDWRRHPGLLAKAEAALSTIGAKLVGQTPCRSKNQPLRPLEIMQWLAENELAASQQWVVLDDRMLLEEVGGASLQGRFVQCDAKKGLDVHTADQLIRLLRARSRVRVWQKVSFDKAWWLGLLGALCPRGWAST